MLNLVVRSADVTKHSSYLLSMSKLLSSEIFDIAIERFTRFCWNFCIRALFFPISGKANLLSGIRSLDEWSIFSFIISIFYSSGCYSLFKFSFKITFFSSYFYKLAFDNYLSKDFNRMLFPDLSLSFELIWLILEVFKSVLPLNDNLLVFLFLFIGYFSSNFFENVCIKLLDCLLLRPWGDLFLSLFFCFYFSGFTSGALC